MESVSVVVVVEIDMTVFYKKYKFDGFSIDIIELWRELKVCLPLNSGKYRIYMYIDFITIF